MALELNDAITKLGKLLQADQLIIFVGSGISRPSNIPTWDGFLDEFLDMAKHLTIEDETHKTELEQIIEDAKRQKVGDIFKDPIRVATVVKEKINECSLSDNALAQQEYNNWLSKTVGNKKPNELHRLIIGTDYPYILTTNYDLLLEKAASEIGALQLATSASYTFKDGLKIMSAIHRNKPCIIHIHGSATGKNDLEEIILTKEDYNQIIRKKHEGFSFALRMLFTRYSTLFVGYGGSDPHLEDISEELAEYYPINQEERHPLPHSFLVTRRDKYDTVFERWKNRVRTDLIIIDNYHQYQYLLDELRKMKPRKRVDGRQLSII